MCVELGLHRRDSLFKNFPDEEDRANAVRLFWSIYCLDRRWSFGTGMPFAMQDADIDPSIPGPVSLSPPPFSPSSLCLLPNNIIGNQVSLSQCDDLVFPYRITGVAVCGRFRQPFPDGYQEGRHRLPRLPDFTVAEGYSA